MNLVTRPRALYHSNSESEHNSYGFISIGFVSMETLLTFDLEESVKTLFSYVVLHLGTYISFDIFYGLLSLVRIIPRLNIWQISLLKLFINISRNQSTFMANVCSPWVLLENIS